MKKRPMTFTVLAAAAMISLGVSASLAQGGSGGGGGGTTSSTGVDLQLTGKASTGSPNPGDPYNYTFTIKNSGSGPAAAVVFTLPIPRGVTANVVTLNGSILPCALGPDPAGEAFICKMGSLLNGAQATIIVGVTAPPVAGTVTATGSVTSMTPDPNPANNNLAVSITVKAPTGGACKGGVCDTSTATTAAPCAALTSVSATVGYYLTNAALWNNFTVQSCSTGSESVSVQVQDLNTLTGAVDYDVTWSITLSPAQNYGMVLDNDFAAFSAPYTVTYTVRDSSGNVLATANGAATTGPQI